MFGVAKQALLPGHIRECPCESSFHIRKVV